MAKGCSSNNYEEARKQRLEENKKRFEDLGISKISKILTKVTSPAKKSQNRLPRLKLKTNDEVEPRRSSRPRNQVTSYTEEFGTDLPDRSSYLRKRSRSSSSSWESYVARPLEEIKVATKQERIRAYEAAEALQINLQSSKPSFIKSMVRSHVYSCFWLGLPSRFCEEHLPRTVYNMTLEDEDGSEYDAVYIGSRSGLSGGWRAFALEHKLDDGDALVFELVEPARFKIYVVRAFPNIDEEEEENDTLVQEENMDTSKATKVSKATSNRGSKSKKTKKQKHVIETKESESSEESMPEINIGKKFNPERVIPTRKTRSSRIEVQKKPQPPTSTDSESSEEPKMQTLKKTISSQKKMQKTSEVPTTPEPKEEAQIEIVKRKTRSSQKKMQEISEVPTTPEPKRETQIEIVKPKTRSSQKQMQKISEVSTALESKEEAQVETVKPKAAAKLSNKTQKSKEGNDCEIDESINTEQLLPKDNFVETVDANMSEKKEHVQVNDLEAVKEKPDEKPSKRASQIPRKKSAPKFFRKRA
ncbi:hypothetical protein P8452_75999 [Trifolium repens]|nr:hypothetical protein P8452_75999 [Trifolium repens]